MDTCQDRRCTRALRPRSAYRSAAGAGRLQDQLGAEPALRLEQIQGCRLAAELGEREQSGEGPTRAYAPVVDHKTRVQDAMTAMTEGRVTPLLA